MAAARSEVSLRQWQHVAGVWDGKELRLYLDGQLQETRTGVDYCTQLSLSPMFLGADPDSLAFTTMSLRDTCTADCARRASRGALNTRIRSRPPNDSKRRPARSACTISRSIPAAMRSIAPATGITESSSERNTQRTVFGTHHRSMAN